MLKSASIYLLVPLILVAQQAAPRVGGRQRSGASQVQTKPEDLCSMEGQVVNNSTGEPLGKAALTLRRIDSNPPGPGALPGEYTATSNASGKFSMSNIEPGKYKLSAIRTGFVNAEYGARDYLQPGTTLSLEARLNMTDVQLRMTPNGVVIGRIVDEDREPMAFVQVQAMRLRYSQGRKQLASYGNATTNDIGEYRIFGLPPGRYYISASPRMRPTRNATSQSDEEYVPTFYPGATDRAAAVPLDIGPGVQFRGADVALAKRRTVHVKGHLTDASGSTGRGRPMIYLIARGLAGFALTNRPSSIDANGNFDIQGVAAGSYTLVAAIMDRERSLASRLPVEVGNSNVENLNIAINPALNVSGQVRLDGQAAASLSAVQVILRPKDPSGLLPVANPSARVKDDGSFSLAGVNPDNFSVALSGLPDGYYVKAIQAGGQDVLGPGLDLSKGAAVSLDIVLAPHAGQASGVVQSDRQQPASGATVVLVPQEKERIDLPQYYRTATTDAAGGFTLNNLDPGQYRVYAWKEVESGAYMDPEFMAPLENRGEPLTIREGSQENLQLKLIG